MTSAQKLQIALVLYHSARKIKNAHLKCEHPERNAEQINKKVREIFMYASA